VPEGRNGLQQLGGFAIPLRRHARCSYEYNCDLLCSYDVTTVRMQQSLEMEGASRTSELQMPVRRSRRQRSSAVEPRATTQHPRSSLAALPATAAASADRAETAASLHKWAEALAMYERAIALHGGAEARPEECASWLDGVADCLVALARWGYALAAADIVIGIDELYFNGWFCRAQALAHWGEEEGGVRWQESVASFEECLRCDMPAIDERAVRKELQWTMDAMRTTVERAAARAHELCDPGRVDGEGEAVEPDYTAAREAYSEALDSCVSGHELEGSLRDARASCHLHFRFWPCAELAERDALRAVELQVLLVLLVLLVLAANVLSLSPAAARDRGVRGDAGARAGHAGRAGGQEGVLLPPPERAAAAAAAA